MTFEFLHHPDAPLQLESALYVVATPIGNLDDITLRALRVLESVRGILAEDTRVARRLLAHFGIRQQALSCHEHNERERLAGVLQRLREGEALALVSDAGTPLISDPGFPLVRAVRDAGLRIVPVPGASALTTALSVSGLPCDQFVFEGFAPSREAARRARLAELAGESRTLGFYEAGRRIPALLEDLASKFGADRRVVLLRELTKVHEQVLGGPVGTLAARAREGEMELRGEFVVLVAGLSGVDSSRLAEARRIRDILKQEMPASQAARMAARITGVDRRTLYAGG